MSNRVASVYFKPDPHRSGYEYREGYWIYKQGDEEHQFETFSQGCGLNKNAERYAQEQLDLDKVDEVYIYSKTGSLRYTKQGIQYKKPEEILRIAKTYLRIDKESSDARMKLWSVQSELERTKKDMEDLMFLYIHYREKAKKYDQIMEAIA